MALTQVSKHIGNDPATLNALYAAFTEVEEVLQPNNPESLIKVFRIKGQGVPHSDKYVEIVFGTTLNGSQTKVISWNYPEKLPESIPFKK